MARSRRRKPDPPEHMVHVTVEIDTDGTPDAVFKYRTLVNTFNSEVQADLRKVILADIQEHVEMRRKEAGYLESSP